MLNWNVKSEWHYISKRGFINRDTCHRNRRAPTQGTDSFQPEGFVRSRMGVLSTPTRASQPPPHTSSCTLWGPTYRNWGIACWACTRLIHCSLTYSMVKHPLLSGDCLSVAWAFLRSKRLLLLWLVITLVIFFPQTPSYVPRFCALTCCFMTGVRHCTC